MTDEQSAKQSDKHLTPRELAARLHVSVGTLAQWRYAGKGPRFLRVGGTGVRGPVLYRLADVETYEEANTIGSTSERPGAAGNAA